MHRGQAGARFHPELLDQQLAGVGVDAERLGLAPAAVQRQHQQLAQPFAQRVLRRQVVEIADDLGVQADVQGGGAQVLGGGHLPLGQPQPLGVGVRPGDAGECAAAEQVQRLGQQPVRLVLVARGPGGRGFAAESLEDRQVEGLARDAQRVAVGDRDQHLGRAAHLPPGLDDGAQTGDVGAQGGYGLRWGPLAPECVDQVLRGDRASGMQQKGGQDGLLLGGAKGEGLVVEPGLDRTKDLEAQRRGLRRLPKLHEVPRWPVVSFP